MNLFKHSLTSGLAVLSFFVLSFFALSPELRAESDVSQIDFVSDSYLEVAEINQLTAQAQDESGEPVDGIGQIACIRVTSTSATGLFDSSDSLENPSDTLVTNWASSWTNRNFYYLDPEEGDYTLELEFAFRPDGAPTCPNWPYEEWEIDFVAEQDINVSEDPLDSDENGDENGDSEPGPQPGDPQDESPHFQPGPLGESEPDPVLEVYAGRDRLTSAGSPIKLRAEITKIEEIPESQISFNWSLGDGSTETGREVTYSYNYPGEYAVILTAEGGGETALSRLDVKVVEPDLEITEANKDYIEIFNHSDFEVNLYNWRLSDGQKTFVPQADLIIGSQTGLKLSSKITFLDGESEEIALSDSERVGVAIFSPKPEAQGEVLGDFDGLPDNQKEEILERMWQEVWELREQVQSLDEEQNSAEESVDSRENFSETLTEEEVITQGGSVENGNNNENDNLSGDDVEHNESLTENFENIDNNPPDSLNQPNRPNQQTQVIEIETDIGSGFWRSILNLPSRVFSFFFK